jgi:NAD(P)H-nitrite reductase large subunit
MPLRSAILQAGMLHNAGLPNQAHMLPHHGASCAALRWRCRVKVGRGWIAVKHCPGEAFIRHAPSRIQCLDVVLHIHYKSKQTPVCWLVKVRAAQEKSPGI